MRVIYNRRIPSCALPGIEHRTLARRGDGVEHLEIWMQTLEPGAATPFHYHECEKVVIALLGVVRVIGGGEDLALPAGCTLVVPPRQVHQIVNTGGAPVWIVAVLSETPARSFQQDGRTIPTPRQPQPPEGKGVGRGAADLISLEPVWSLDGDFPGHEGNTGG